MKEKQMLRLPAQTSASLGGRGVGGGLVIMITRLQEGYFLEKKPDNGFILRFRFRSLL